MDNSFIFRFERADVQALLNGFSQPLPKDHILVTVYAEAVSGQSILKVKAQAFKVEAGNPVAVSQERSGCPVPPCVKNFLNLSPEEKQECIALVDEAVENKDA